MPADEAQPAAVRPWRGIAHGVLAVYWFAIFTLTHVPRLPPPPDVPQADKWAHLLAYAVLAILYFTARATAGPLGLRQVATGVVIFALYGAADELLQILVGRSCELLDWVADVTGALIGTALWMLIARWRRARVAGKSTW